MVLGGRKWRLQGGEEAPPPKGHLVVYMGCGGGEKEAEELPQRYFILVIYFNHPLFGELSREAEEEFGIHHQARITSPCLASRFERVQTRTTVGSTATYRRSFRRGRFNPCVINNYFLPLRGHLDK